MGEVIQFPVQADYIPFVIPKPWITKTRIIMPPPAERIITLGEHYDHEQGCTIEHTFEITTPCHCWTGWNDGKKNGQAHGKFREKGKAFFVHRRSWEMANGRLLTDDEVVDHLCRTAACWNPTHLEAVSMGVNTARGLGRYYQYKRAKEYGE